MYQEVSFPIPLTAEMLFGGFLGLGMLCFNTRLGCLDGTANLDFVEDLGIFFRSIDETGRHVKPYRYFRTPLYNKFERAADNMYRYYLNV